MKLPAAIVALFLCAFVLRAENAFFAMDTIARGGPEKVVPMLRELGYAGLGGAPGDVKMAAALKDAGLRYFNGYITLGFSAGQSALTDSLKRKLDAMKGTDSALWIAISQIQTSAGRAANSSSDGDETAVAAIREIAGYAGPLGVKVALYPHTASWLERVEDGIRVAGKVNHESVGVTFNLCHWLKVEGSERDPFPVLKEAMPKLMFVTINGADTGDTKHMNWGQLIQPLGRGTYDVAGFMKKVREAGYDGPVGFQGFGIREEPAAVLKESIEAWKRFGGK